MSFPFLEPPSAQPFHLFFRTVPFSAALAGSVGIGAQVQGTEPCRDCLHGQHRMFWPAGALKGTQVGVEQMWAGTGHGENGRAGTGKARGQSSACQPGAKGQSRSAPRAPSSPGGQCSESPVQAPQGLGQS